MGIDLFTKRLMLYFSTRGHYLGSVNTYYAPDPFVLYLYLLNMLNAHSIEARLYIYNIIMNIVYPLSASGLYRRLGAKGSYLTLVRVADRIL